MSLADRTASPRAARAARAAGVTLVSAALVWGSTSGSAHKGLVSPYTYSAEVQPILEQRCGRCHVEGGPAPMSLLTYEKASAWSEGIRAQIASGAMPPSPVDSAGPAVRNAPAMTPRELDVLLTWAAGGTPAGPPAAPREVARHTAWGLGRPDLVLPVTARALRATGATDVRELTVTTGLTEPAWLTAVDLRPAAGIAISSAVLRVDHGPVVRVWTPDDEPVATPEGTAYELPARAALRLTLRLLPSTAGAAPASGPALTIAMYLAKAGARPQPIRQAALDLDADTAGGAATRSARAPEGMTRVLALQPELDVDYGTVALDAVSPSSQTPLLILRSPRADSPRKYWLDEPARVSPGARITAATTPTAPTAGRSSVRGGAFRVILDYLAN